MICSVNVNIKSSIPDFVDRVQGNIDIARKIARADIGELCQYLVHPRSDIRDLALLHLRNSGSG